ncbi:MAG TPA: hypothetical protein DIW43_04360 [Spongiibacteraceae bacterium]|nr:hypothetical protein [Spongiibacteraceae bacterium]HCS26661.1 hypothetical protein [Spongiibacteraceae bacterium]|tara:strand:+ start:1588 stop:2124 length:537 start_codon:yes stop_codon:yes gene_type:complete
MSELATKIVALHDALRRKELSHAFGGALALAWCTERARATIDIDVNIFVPKSRASDVVAAMPKGISVSKKQYSDLQKEGQVRIWWDKTPVDIFLNTTELHETMVTRSKTERFFERDIPFLCCSDLAVFKAFFNRTKDWADLEEMLHAGTIDVATLTTTLSRYLGADDERVDKLLELIR